MENKLTVNEYTCAKTIMVKIEDIDRVKEILSKENIKFEENYTYDAAIQFETAFMLMEEINDAKNSSETEKNEKETELNIIKTLSEKDMKEIILKTSKKVTNNDWLNENMNEIIKDELSETIKEYKKYE